MNAIVFLRSVLPFSALRCALLLILFLVIPAARAADPLTDTLQQGLLAEEVQHDLDAAIAAYQSVVIQHDQQRQLAATALFRLGECYRKQGKTTDAVAQYQRLLAEFSDQTELARLSRQNLDTLGAGIPISPGPLTPAAQRQKDLLAQELVLVEQQIAEVQKMIGVGRAGSSDLIPLQREALALQRQMAALDDARQNDLLREVIPPSAPAVDSPELVDGISQEEFTEIERLKELIRNSPDLINTTVRGDPPLHTAAIKGQLAVARFLIQQGFNVNVGDGARKSPLHRAVEHGHKGMVELLLAAKADVNAADNLQQTPLHIAASLGFEEIAKVLLSAGANANAKAPSGAPLHAAVRGGRVALIELLLDQGADLEVSTVETPIPGSTPLLQAVSDNSERGVVELLLARGANVNATNTAGDSVLHVAVESEVSVRALRAILEKGPNLEARGSRNLTPLQIASVEQKHSIAQVLLEAGADPNVRHTQAGTRPATVRTPGGQIQLRPGGRTVRTIRYQPDGSTPLHWALLEGDRTLAELLIQHGADPNATDNDGYTPLLAAVMPRPGASMLVLPGTNRAGIAMDPGLISLLLDSGADPNVVDKSGMSLLQHALRVGSIELVEGLLSREVNPNTTDPTGATPVHAAALWSDASAMRLLLDHGADIELRDQFGNTPLHVAARAGSKEVVQLLLDRGAPVNAPNTNGSTPLNLVENPSRSDLFATEPGRGLVAAFDRTGKQVRSVAAPPPAEIAELLIAHGAEGPGINTSPQSSSPSIPSDNGRPAVDPAQSAIEMRLKAIQSRSNPRSAAGVISWQKWDSEALAWATQ